MVSEMTSQWKPADLSPLALAFIGDAIWEVYARDRVIGHGIRRPHDLHRATTAYVCAKAQAWLAGQLADELTDEERDVLRRGRNAKAGHLRRSAGAIEYRYSTGFEALIGHLYGSGQRERLDHICSRAMALIEGTPDNQRSESDGEDGQ